MSSLRPVYMVLSPRSLDYARLAITTLLQRSVEPLALHLITDSAEDRQKLEQVVEEIAPASQHRVQVHAEADLNDAEADRFARYPHLRDFRHGHPCWRKITDPLLLSEPGAEMILLDPDLYFPNRFCFEQTPATGLMLMWQQPNCLLPPETVRAAMHAQIPLARHVDIGVAHWRLTPEWEELEWINWLVERLANGHPLPRKMHVEAIMWAAIAMRFGGGYLDPNLWVCWHRTQSKRVRLKLGASGRSILQPEPWSSMKCFHAGGEAKWWLPQIVQQGRSVQDLAAKAQPQPIPFVELTPARYEREQMMKGMIGKLGYYKLFGAGA